MIEMGVGWHDSLYHVAPVLNVHEVRYGADLGELFRGNLYEIIILSILYVPIELEPHVEDDYFIAVSNGRHVLPHIRVAADGADLDHAAPRAEATRSRCAAVSLSSAQQENMPKGTPAGSMHAATAEQY